MSLEYPCVYFDKGWCRRCPDDPDACVFGPCDEERPSRGDEIRRKSDFELAQALVRCLATATVPSVWGFCVYEYFSPEAEKCKNEQEAIAKWCEWLMQPPHGKEKFPPVLLQDKIIPLLRKCKVRCIKCGCVLALMDLEAP